MSSLFSFKTVVSLISFLVFNWVICLGVGCFAFANSSISLLYVPSWFGFGYNLVCTKVLVEEAKYMVLDPTKSVSK